MCLLRFLIAASLPDVLQVMEHNPAQNARIVFLLALIASLPSQPK